MPIRSEIGAVPEFSPCERRKAVKRRARTIAREKAVRIFWLLFQVKLEAPICSEPPATPVEVLITLLPR
jgi:hypothetical protein